MSEQDEMPAAGGNGARKPGHKLAAARERADIDREEIATTLHLPIEQVEALERDDYSQLPPPTFVRGYLRTYAREVGLDADELAAEYDAIIGSSTEPEIVVSAGVPDPAAGRGAFVAMAIVVAVALVGAVAWWLQQPAVAPLEPVVSTTAEDASEPASAPAGETVAGDADQVVSATAADVAQNSAAESATREPAATASGAADSGMADSMSYSGEPSAGDTAVDAAEAPATESTVVAADVVAEGVSSAEPSGGTGAESTQVDGAATGEPDEAADAQPLIADSNQPTATSRAELVPTEAATVGPDRLLVEVNGRSWLEVYDSRGRTLAYTLYSGDERVELNGWAPFNVFLGNSPDVIIRFQDRAVDLSPFVRSDNTASVRVDAEGAHQR